MIVPVLSRDKWCRLLVLCGLYVSQGVPFGFVTITLAAALSTAGASTEDIGKVIAMATLPWALKWIAGPCIDRFTIASMGRRRPWILLGQGGMVLSLLAMASLSNPTENLKLLAWLVFIHNCFNAMQDVAADALAVDLLPPEERGRVTGFMYGSKYLGTAIGGAGLSIVLGRQGLSSAFMAMIIVVSTLTLLPLLTIERPGQSILPRPGRGDPASDDSSPGETQQPSFLEIFTRLANAFATRAAALTAAPSPSSLGFACARMAAIHSACWLGSVSIS